MVISRMGKSGKEVQRVKYKTELDKLKKKHNTTDSSYTVMTANGERKIKYSIIGPDNFATTIKRAFPVIGKSFYGKLMLIAIAKSKIEIYFAYYKGKTPVTSDKKLPHPYNEKNNNFTVVQGDFNTKLLPKYRIIPVAKKIDNSLLKKMMSPIPNIQNSNSVHLMPEMLLAHELFHVWDITGDRALPKYFRNSLNVGDYNFAETHAVRYTNQIRIDLGLGYIRVQYTIGSRRNIDLGPWAMGRWRSHRQVLLSK